MLATGSRDRGVGTLFRVAGSIAIPFAVVGFILGWLSARLTEWVTPPDDAPAIRGRNLFIADPLVQIGLGVIWGAIPFVIGGDNLLRWLEAGLLAVPLVQVGVTDLRTRYVYTVVAAVGLVLGLAVGWQFHGVDWWWSAVGAVGGGIAFGLLYGLGKLLYRGGEPMARGDITIAAMVGAGAATTAATALVYGVIASGLLAVGVLIIVRSRKVYMPYGPGLCIGGLITLLIQH